MVLSGRRQLSASLISARILYCAYYYALFFGLICFRLKRSHIEKRLVAQSCFWYKWFCALVRIGMCYLYVMNHRSALNNWTFSHMDILIFIRLVSCLVLAAVIIVVHLLHGQKVLVLTNRYLRIYRRVNALSAKQDTGFGGKRELTLLILKIVSVLSGLYIVLFLRLPELKKKFIIAVACKVYNIISTTLVSHICFLGYLSVGALYDRTNCYVRSELRQQLQDLNNYRAMRQPSRRRLQAAEQRLDECLAIYDEIHKVAMGFYKLFELALSLILFFDFMNMALVVYIVMLSVSYSAIFWIYSAKILVDMVVLIMTIHGACRSSRIVRNLSLENYYVCERSDWHMKLEMFLNRLTFYEFRVCPLGLFEVTNKLILVFLSAILTYLTYILQYSLKSQNIQSHES